MLDNEALAGDLRSRTINARVYTVDDKYLPVSHAHVQTSRDINKQLTGIYVLKQHGASSGRWSLSVSPQAAPSK